MKHNFLILAITICTLHSFAQNTFIKIFSDVDATKGFSGRHIVKTIDGNYSFLCTNNYLPIVVRIDENGNEFGRFSIQKYRLNPVCLAVNNQFDYFFVGHDSLQFTGYKEQTDTFGGINFHFPEFGAVGESLAHGVYKTPDNGILYSFWNNSEMCYDPEYYYKVDSIGNYQWRRDISNNMSNPSKQSFQFLSANEICAVGPHLTGCYDTVQYYSSDLGIFDTTGSYVNFNYNELYHTVDTTYGGGFILASINQFVRMDTSTGVVWTNPMPSGMSFQIALRQIADSFFVLAGDQFVTNFGQQIMLNKYDWAGNLLWSKNFGGSENEYFSNMVLTSDGGFLISGTTNSYGTKPKAFILKADSMGNSATMPLITASSNIVCSGDSTALILPSGYTYLWSTGATTQTIYATSANSYWAELTLGGNQYYSDTITLNVISTTKPNLGSDTILCSGTEFIVDAGTTYSAYRWSTGSFGHSDTVSIGGNYIVEAIDSNSCSSFDTIQVSFLTLPPFSLGPDIYQCDTTQIILNAPGVLQWTWNDGSNDTTLTVTTSGIYSLAFTNGVCSDTNYISVNLFIPTQVNLFDDTVVCLNQSLLLDAGPGFLDYAWQDGTHSQTYTVSSLTPATLQYSVTVVDSNGCSTSDDIVVDFEVCPTTNDHDFSRGIRIYPNPIRNSSHLQIESILFSDLSVEIVSVTGELVYRKETQFAPIKILMNTFAPGIYILKILEKKTGKYFNSKLVIN